MKTMEQAMKTKKTIVELIQELKDTQASLALAEQAESEARATTTATRNRLNETQKAINDWLAEEIKQAEYGTHWQSLSEGRSNRQH